MTTTVKMSLGTKMTQNDALAEATDLGPAYPEAAVVTVTLADGSTFRKINKGATGSPVNPMSDIRINEKFLDCVTPILGMDAAELLLYRLRNLDGLAASASLFNEDHVDRVVAAR